MKFIEIDWNTLKQNHLSQIVIRIMLFCILYTVNRFAFNFIVEKSIYYKIIFNDGFLRYIGFVILAIVLALSAKKIRSIKYFKQNKIETIFCVGLLLFIYTHLPWIFSFGQKEIDRYAIYLITIFVTHVLIFLAIFGTHFAGRFKFELIFSTLIIFPLFCAFLLTDYIWPYLSGGTIFLLGIVLPWLHVPYSIEPNTYHVIIKEFDIYIGAPCAGIYSMTAFTTLYSIAVLMLILHHKIYIIRSIVLFILGLLATYILNTIRVLLILLVGAYYSPEFAIQAFHSGIGSLLFLLLFIGYIYKLIPLLIIPVQTK
ncbi:MAG: hypothetical protein A2821_01425 [Candidatus Magasanikbacteria bacterium RIFCSPHIGHO2_01_FULL_41_23]|uniref:Exosortase n=1 Tax=Candidatus Magasanikbacteria bacterium RIFCSPLOWO2_01_FULL_40_15 TaxID=1798686 RepID=A0A1F6N4R3_9BACT|nr:MAG: hypothetical protein A2821_01425 [Candidatus Magasanikbacteria bacterium RIFCSPHIGHO2_01_FULL_41_23]OGH66785.1 MAG: hypothetical protein A3C66_01730 [Candidatus Magasanikbacteria bacterium RIFCSPHIGHO2_02_FULL_41_35]OGH74583.1 MAG: hypothetical protein A3F22_03135 [Candidatus Magasanikbacteria bacterium RIFCSPHIGHO2_12_FULL_41_16]OGH78872.1 MAG: hypothetical protein A2983_00885 [Candidatus Magasanikbacteria bacterium RIFCSPLOWO2_01_FULL_40_15]